MKNLFAAALGTVLVAGAIAAQAQTAPAAGNPEPGTVATISTPYTLGSGRSEALPVFNYRGGVPVRAGFAAGRSGGIQPWDTAADLVNQTGGAR